MTHATTPQPPTTFTRNVLERLQLDACSAANTLFNLPLEWLNDWWPMAPIALGAYLIYRARQDQQS